MIQLLVSMSSVFRYAVADRHPRMESAAAAKNNMKKRSHHPEASSFNPKFRGKLHSRHITSHCEKCENNSYKLEIKWERRENPFFTLPSPASHLSLYGKFSFDIFILRKYTQIVLLIRRNRVFQSPAKK